MNQQPYLVFDFVRYDANMKNFIEPSADDVKPWFELVEKEIVPIRFRESQ